MEAEAIDTLGRLWSTLDSEVFAMYDKMRWMSRSARRSPSGVTLLRDIDTRERARDTIGDLIDGSVG